MRDSAIKLAGGCETFSRPLLRLGHEKNPLQSYRLHAVMKVFPCRVRGRLPCELIEAILVSPDVRTPLFIGDLRRNDYLAPAFGWDHLLNFRPQADEEFHFGD